MSRTPQPKDCGRKDDLVSYLYGELTPSERRSFDLHLKECTSCRKEAEDLSLVRTAMQEEWQLEPSPSLVDVAAITGAATPARGCDRQEDLVGYLYDEATPEERKSFNLHLDECGVCRAELKAFKGVRDTMQDWDVQRVPRIELNIRPTFWQSLRQFFNVTPLWGRFVMAGAGALVLLAFLNVQISVGSQGVTFSTGFSKPTPQPVADTQLIAPPSVDNSTPNQPTPVKYDEAKIKALVEEMVKLSETRQEAKLKTQLQNISLQLQTQNQAALVKAVASLNKEHRVHLLNALQEVDRQKEPDLLDLLGQASSVESGAAQ
ncbi:MAG: zf-HC2 domain-containing protein [Blastocatellia bacterium]|nr:zf-HC2 domain-containing protein [Blastocatellia bacterium]